MAPLKDMQYGDENAKQAELYFWKVTNTAGKKVECGNERQVHASDTWRKHAKQCIWFVHQLFHLWAFVSNEKSI